MDGQCVLVGRHHGERIVGRERHHLGHHHIRARIPQRLRQGVAADEGDGEEHGVHAGVRGPIDQHRYRLIRADHDHRLRVALAKIQQGRLHRSGISRVQPDRHRLHAPPRKRQANPLVTVAAERIVLVHDGDAIDAQVAGQAGDHFLGFLLVRGPQVDDVVPGGIAQKRGAGERGDVGYVSLGGDRCSRT